MFWFADFLFNLSIFWVTSLRDEMYMEIAKGFHEYSSYLILNLAITTFVSIVSAIILRLILSYNENLSYINKFSLIILIRANVKKVRVFLIASYLIFCILFFSLQLVQFYYINKQITYYNQLITIVRPYISSEDYNLFNSRFAQIYNKETFEEITGQLEELISKNNLRKPTPTFLYH